MNKNYFVNLNNYIIQTPNLSKYSKALLQKPTQEFSVKENPSIKIVLDIESLNKTFDAEEVKCGLKNYNLVSELKKTF